MTPSTANGTAVAPETGAGSRRARRSRGTEARNGAAHPVDTVVETGQDLVAGARAVLGGRGDEGAPEAPGRLRASGGASPVVALGLLALTAELHTYGLAFLGPEIRRELGVGVGALLTIRGVLASLAALRVARNFQTRNDRAYLCLSTAAMWSLLTIGIGLSTGSPMLPLLGMALAASSVHALHPSLLMDSYAPGTRVKAFSYYRAFGTASIGVAIVVIGAVLALGFTWRVAFLVMGVLSVASVVWAGRLRDAAFGQWDVEPIKRLVRRASGDDSFTAFEAAPAVQAGRNGSRRSVRDWLSGARPAPERDYFSFPDVVVEESGVRCEGYAEAAASQARQLRFGEVVQRLLSMATLRGIFAGWAMLGALLTPLFGYVSFFLEDRWAMGFGARGIVWGIAAVVSVAALVWFAPQGERRFQEDPSAFMRFGARLLAAGVVGIAAGAFVPFLPVSLFLLVVGMALVGLVQPVLMTSMLSVVPPRMRPHAGALASVFLAVIGALGGSLLLGGLDRRFGVTVAMASLLLPGLVAAAQLARSAKTIDTDLDALANEVVNAEGLAVLSRRGERVPLLSCRNIDFAYGPIQVLFDVNFSVDEGEMVALLGTNGSGKSTLLNVISGVGLPMRGSVIYEGSDVTYLDAVRRVGLGIAQVPGGKAVFGPLTVVENLRMLGYTIRRDKRQVDAAIDRCFEAFPRLAERRNQFASTLSGGEQQMLGLSTALITRPKLLLIDELSLGLAPVIVGQLLDAVRQINASGTAIVLVEQSVNIALTLVNHAYFMEKGEIRFDGPSATLLERPDLVRSVFLQGAGASLSQNGKGRREAHG